MKEVLEKKKEEKCFDAWYKQQAEKRAAELSRNTEMRQTEIHGII